MFWRTVFVFHLVLATLDLLKRECTSPRCSLTHSRLLLALGVSGGLHISLSCRPLTDLLRRSSGGSVRSAVLAVNLVVLVIAGLYELWEPRGMQLRRAEQVWEWAACRASPPPLAERIPGAWRWRWSGWDPVESPGHARKEPITTLHDITRSSSEESTSLSEHADSGFESATHDTPPKRPSPRPTRLHRCPLDPPIVIDSSTHPDALTLHASDLALLGKYLARAHGMFAWRVYPLTRLSHDPYTDEPAEVLVQRIDAFLKPVGRPVHYVEILLEWVPSAMSENTFLVFARHPASKPRNGVKEESSRNDVRLVGTRVHAFRARVCNPLTTPPAEHLLNKLGLGSRWTCSWAWDTPLGQAFDGQEYTDYARRETVVERWDGDVEAHWRCAGRTGEEVEGWKREVREFGWADGGEEEEGESDWTEDEDEESWSEESETDDEEWGSCTDGSAESDGVDWRTVQDVFSAPAVVQVAKDTPATPADSRERLDTTQTKQAVSIPKPFTPYVESDSESDSDVEEVVLYPRNAAPVEDESDELILYRVPRTPLAVYAPVHSPSPPTHILGITPPTVYAPTPTYAPGLKPAPNSSLSARVLPAPSQPANTIQTLTQYAHASAFTPRAFNGRAALHTTWEVVVTRREFCLDYNVMLERAGSGSGVINGVRALIELKGCAFSLSATGSSKDPAEAAECAMRAILSSYDDADAEGQQEGQGKGKKKTRRGGKKLTARRHRQRAETTARVVELAVHLRGEAERAAQEEGMELVEVALCVDERVLPLPASVRKGAALAGLVQSGERGGREE
ncbi:hypothetical protein OH77DRAFT_832524 [Trametes cingulata]|nr:hypothetical protein OH77DRAFT_832524 [Trametes cingulata]